MNINKIKKKTNEQNKNPKTKQNNDRLSPLYTMYLYRRTLACFF